MPGLIYDSDDNAPYLRYGAAQYLGGAGFPANESSYVAGWITERDPTTGQRSLKYAFIRVPGANCRARGNKEAEHLDDVQWVHHGGHVPEGFVWQTTYPSHGYLVWSTAGQQWLPPVVQVGRFYDDGTSFHYEPVYLDTDEPTPFKGRPVGMTPSMASNTPFPASGDLELAADPRRQLRILLACWRASLLPPPWNRPWIERCESSHRLLLVYAGDPRWLDQGEKLNIEKHWCHAGDPGCAFWMAYSIKYVLLKPTGEVVTHGTIADVRYDYPEDNVYPDTLGDHAIYPEVVWNAHTRRWDVMWEERYKSTRESGVVINVRKVATVDEQGRVERSGFFRRCRNDYVPTVPPEPGPVPAPGQGDPGATAPAGPGAGGGDEPPWQPLERGYCYPINLANDYYSRDWISAGGLFPDRNPDHDTLVRAYSWHDYNDFPPGFHWMDELGDDLLEIIYESQPPLESVKPNMEPIGYAWIRDHGYENASYIKAGVQGCRNRFWLLVDAPDDPFDADKLFHTVDVDGPHPECDQRQTLAMSSGFFNFVTLFVERNVSGGQTVRFGSYYYVP